MEDNELFYQDYRMSIEQYDTILTMVQLHLQKFPKRTRKDPPGLRLALTLSIVLMATADAEYKFTWVDVGDYGFMSDRGIWTESTLGSALEEGSVDLPLPRLLPNSNIMFSHFL
ncbi:nuclease harbi1 [Lasius niger]|uniref:Nuclease harbi1 n=1 Tax=Lasius niger TaxID=67767 RepID=A0A0J7K2K7_LASNI|nr:nuclease harbi1 [Lasius niger]